ncbi:hypothetical protein EMCG_07654 [[Emmonsia] crescens]|uniref:Uncharacterized protein n=1 Tax=[Emmonsia] crescens TaxID=73230 RepID=A0A0G2I7R0_9EURO|nr:hypothetical protein EMCG_07654 [Emmonsia crescens UAMH 3008]
MNSLFQGIPAMIQLLYRHASPVQTHQPAVNNEVLSTWGFIQQAFTVIIIVLSSGQDSSGGF